MPKIYDCLNRNYIKNNSFWLAFILLGFSNFINAQIISDNFDAYNIGPLSPQALHWTTWSGVGEEDGIIIDTVSNSESNSLLIGNYIYEADILLLLGNKDSGSYSLDYNLYIPSGKVAYYNFQEDEIPGVAWNLDVYFNRDGAAPGTGSFDQSDSTFTFPEDEWFAIHQVIDLDADLMSFWINGELVFENFVFDGNLGSLNFWSISDNNDLYIDDLVYYGDVVDAVQELTSMDSFNLYPNPNDGNFTIASGNLSGTFVIDVVDVTGRLVYSEQIELSKNEEKAVNTNDLNTGVYILRMVDNATKEVYTTRVSIR